VSIKDLRVSEVLARDVICGRRPELLSTPLPSSDRLMLKNFSRERSNSTSIVSRAMWAGCSVMASCTKTIQLSKSMSWAES